MIYSDSKETHEMRVSQHPLVQRTTMAVRIKRKMEVQAETVARFLAKSASRETWDDQLTDIEVIATLSRDLKFVRLNYGGVTASFLVNKVHHEGQIFVVGVWSIFHFTLTNSVMLSPSVLEHSVIDEDVPDNIPISPSFFSFEGSPSPLVFLSHSISWGKNKGTDLIFPCFPAQNPSAR